MLLAVFTWGGLGLFLVLVLALVAVIFSATYWLNRGDFFGFWMGWNAMECMSQLLGLCLTVLASLFSNDN